MRLGELAEIRTGLVLIRKKVEIEYEIEKGHRLTRVN